MSTTENNLLPQPFAALTNQLHYALPTSKERLRARATSTMPQLQAFYDAVAPHMDAIMTYLQDFPPAEKDLEPPVLRLVHLAKAFMDISLAIELFHAPDEPNVWNFEDMVLEDH
jgi:hypothetical protein